MDYIYLPMADIYLSLPLLCAIGLMGGIVSSMLGIGGGIIISPSLMSMGIPEVIAISTQLNNAVGTNFSGFLSYQKERDVDVNLAWYFFMGGVGGALVEKFTIYQFQTRSGSIAVLKIMVFAVLIIASIISFIQSQRTKRPIHEKGATMRRWMIYFPWHKIFLRSRVEMSIIVPFGVGFFTGMVTTSLGGGNSLLIAPILTYLLGRNSRVVFGTSLLAGFGINVVVTLISSSINSATIDCVLLPVLAFSGIIGSLVGAKLAYFFKRKILGTIGSLVLAFLAIRMYFELKATNWESVNKGYLFSEKFPLIVKKITAHPDQAWMLPIVQYAHDHPLEYTIISLIMISLFAAIIHTLLNRIINIASKNT
jgi:uncharacterized membrane protein YfcA